MRKNMRTLNVHEVITYEHKNGKEKNRRKMINAVDNQVTSFHRKQTYFSTGYEHERKHAVKKLDVTEKLEAAFNLLNMRLIFAIHTHLILNGLICMNDCAMIASAEMQADCFQRGIGEFFC